MKPFFAGSAMGWGLMHIGLLINNNPLWTFFGIVFFLNVVTTVILYKLDKILDKLNDMEPKNSTES